jgi:hypothetical protein
MARARPSRSAQRRRTPTVFDRIDAWVLAELARRDLVAAIESMNGARFVHDRLELAPRQKPLARN